MNDLNTIKRLNAIDVQVGDVFLDNDPRMPGRRLRVASVSRPEDGLQRAAYLVAVGVLGNKLPGKAARIRLDRLTNPSLFTKLTE